VADNFHLVRHKSFIDIALRQYPPQDERSKLNSGYRFTRPKTGLNALAIEVYILAKNRRDPMLIYVN
jgi:hypothetical protein